MVGKVRIKFKIEVIDNACLVARAAHLMTHGELTEGYSLIRDMQGSNFLTALRMLAEQEVMVKKLSDFKEKQLGDKTANRVNGHQEKSYQAGRHGSRYSTGHVVRAAEVGQSLSKSARSYRRAAQTCATR